MHLARLALAPLVATACLPRPSEEQASSSMPDSGLAETTGAALDGVTPEVALPEIRTAPELSGKLPDALVEACPEPLSPGAARRLLIWDRNVDAVAANSTHVYSSANGSLVRMPLEGGCAEWVLEIDGSILELELDSERLFALVKWDEGRAIVSLSIDSLERVDVVQSLNGWWSVDELVLDGNSLFYPEGFQVLRLDVSQEGSTPEILARGPDAYARPRSLVVAGGSLYWATMDSAVVGDTEYEIPAGVYSVSQAGGEESMFSQEPCTELASGRGLYCRVAGGEVFELEESGVAEVVASDTVSMTAAADLLFINADGRLSVMSLAPESKGEIIAEASVGGTFLATWGRAVYYVSWQQPSFVLYTFAP